ncbi:MAG: hypothetical protein H6837_19915 [Planctomycetes bacterium]|nr:hypothetical protein [Planctomycetota bacterium]
MIPSLLLATAALSVFPQAVEREDPARAVAQIEQALAAGPAPAAEALEKSGRVADPRVIKAVAAALREKDLGVRKAALLALRYNPDKSAVTELLRVKSDKSIIEDVDLGPVFYYALGQHADARALPFLIANLHVVRRRDKILAARVHALGRMRSNAAVQALIKLSRSGRKVGGIRDDISLALTALTGQEAKGRGGWSAWWNDNKGSFQVHKKEPPLPAKPARTWQRLWQVPEAGASKKPADQRKGKDKRNKGAKPSGSPPDAKGASGESKKTPPGGAP